MQFVFFIILIGILFVLSNRNPLLAFWLTLNLYFNPAGFLTEHIGVSVLGPIQIFDFLFLIQVWCFYIIFRGQITLNKLDTLYNKFFQYLLLLLLYYFIINLWLVPLSFGRGDLWLANFIDGRKIVYGVVMGYMIYKTFVRFGGKLLFKIILYTATISFAMFFMSYLLGLKIVPVSSMFRYGNEGLERIGMASYGLFYWLTIFGWVFVFLKSKIFKWDKTIFKWTLALFFVFLPILLMTYTRRTYLELAITPIIIYYIIIKCSKLRINLSKIGAVLIGLTILLSITSPGLMRGSIQIMQDAFLLAFTGKDSRGETNYRVEGGGDLLLTKKYIAENPVFGNGYYYFNYDDKNDEILGTQMTRFAIASDAAREVPIYNVFFERGVVGFAIYIPFYIFILSVGWKLFKFLRRNFNGLLALDCYTVLFSLLSLAILAQTFTIKIYTLFGDFLTPIISISAAILYACYMRVKILTSRYEKKTNHLNQSKRYI